MIWYFLKNLEQIIIICLYYTGISILGIIIYLFSYQSTIYDVPKGMEFDYIIVGAGSAGSTILTGLPRESKILVLEAGTYKPNFLFDIPAITPALQRSLFDWSYSTAKQNSSCRAMKNLSCKWPSGKGFGGSNILNNMIYYRNHPEDFRGWFSDPENYNYEDDILPYFIENEKHLQVDESKFQSKFGSIFLNNSDWNETVIFLKPNVTQNNGLRWSMAHYYTQKLKKVLLNVETVLDAFVTKIIIDEIEKKLEKNLKTACGVEFEKDGIKHIAFARKGIVLSAGTIGTPKILLQSGIGPCDELNSIHVECIENLPVGKNLQDHITTGLDLITLNSTTTGLSILDLISPGSLLQFIGSDNGPITTIGCDAIGFIKKSLNLSPNLGFMIVPLGITTDYGMHLKYNFNIAEHVWNEYFYDLVYHKNTVSILPILLHPKSRGHVKLFNNDTKIMPVINPNYLTHPDDIELLYEGIMLVKSFLHNPKLQELGAKIHDKHFPGCENLKFDSYEYWKCYIRQLTLSVYHPVGTCKIGPYNNSETVVLQTNFQVKNIENLYVVDASVMPNLPSGNPNSVVMMIARKFLKILLENTKK